MAKKDQYYNGFVSIAQTSCDCICILEETLKQYDQKNLQSAVQQIQRHDVMVKETQQSLMTLLARDFLPPLDQEDILNVLRLLANVCRNICYIVSQLECYRLSLVRQDLRKGVSLSHQHCLLINQAMNEWKHKKKTAVMNGYVIQLRTNQEQANQWYHDAMKHLFAQVRQPMDVLIWSRLYDEQRELLRACDEVTCLMISLMIKYS